MVRVKICGITRLQDALAAADLGASALGFVFVPTSPRRITPEAARAIIARVPPFVTCVGVFADAALDQVRAIAVTCRLAQVQLHGDEDPRDFASLGLALAKGVTLRPGAAPARSDIDRLLAAGAGSILIDRPKDDAAEPDDAFFRRAAALVPRHALVLAGGLHSANVLAALELARPAAIDLARGVEDQPGIKNHAKMKTFFERVAQWQQLAS
ncbi:MAG: phosphoribosylanthranilate isomerase [Planctomycetota bacterium]